MKRLDALFKGLLGEIDASRREETQKRTCGWGSQFTTGGSSKSFCDSLGEQLKLREKKWG